MSRKSRRAVPKEGGGHVELILRIEREQLAAAFGSSASSRPITVDQRTCEQVIGISPRRYLEACRAGAFPVREDGKRRVALTADVERFWTRGLVGVATQATGALGHEQNAGSGTREVGLSESFRLMGVS